MSLLLDGAEIARLGDRGDLGHTCREVPEGIKQRPNRCQYHAEPTRDVFDRQTKKFHYDNSRHPNYQAFVAVLRCAENLQVKCPWTCL